MDVYQLLEAMKRQQLDEVKRRKKDYMYPDPIAEGDDWSFRAEEPERMANQVNRMRLDNVEGALQSPNPSQRDLAAQTLRNMQMIKSFKMVPDRSGAIRFRSR